LQLGLLALDLVPQPTLLLRPLSGVCQQTLVVPVQARQLVLLDDLRLLQLTHLHLQLLHLGLVTTLFLFTLLAGGGPVMLQGITGVLVLVLERPHLLGLVSQTHLPFTQRLIETGVAGLLGLQRPGDGVEFLRLGRQSLCLDGYLLLGRCLGQARSLESRLQRCLTRLEVQVRGTYVSVCLLHELGRQVLYEPAKSVAQMSVHIIQGRGLGFQFFQVAVNGGLRPCIAHLNTYRVDAGMLAPVEQCLPRLRHDCLVDATSGHDSSYDFVLCYVLCIYVLKWQLDF